MPWRGPRSALHTRGPGRSGESAAPRRPAAVLGALEGVVVALLEASCPICQLVVASATGELSSGRKKDRARARRTFLKRPCLAARAQPVAAARTGDRDGSSD